MDDSIEAEGGGRNVRIWANYMDHVGVGIATATAHFGPVYVFRNVLNRIRKRFDLTPDSNEARSSAFKAYGISDGFGGGRQYFFHNTLLQAPPSAAEEPGQTLPLGAAECVVGSSNRGLRETWTRNNIIHIWKNHWEAIRVGTGGTAGNEFDFDVYNGVITTSGFAGVYEPNGLDFTDGGTPPAPTYKSGHGWSAGPLLSGAGGTVGEGNFQLDAGSTGLDFGIHLPNFTTDIDNMALARKSGVEVDGAPDAGAHDSASPDAMKFGLPAAQ
jgi:hypothetical protein